MRGGLHLPNQGYIEYPPGCVTRIFQGIAGIEYTLPRLFVCLFVVLQPLTGTSLTKSAARKNSWKERPRISKVTQ